MVTPVQPRCVAIQCVIEPHVPSSSGASTPSFSLTSWVNERLTLLRINTRTSKRPPIAPIEKWVKAKIGLSGAAAKGMAFAVATNLKKVGYKGYRIFTDEFQTETGKYVETLLEQPQYQELVLGDIFDRINIFGTQQYTLTLG